MARRAGLSRLAVRRWQQRFAAVGADGLLRDRTTKPGKPRTPDATVQRVVALTCAELPGEATHWTGRAMAKVAGFVLALNAANPGAHQLQPHRLRKSPAGSAYAFIPSPSLKLATNTTLWRRQQEDIDVNFGEFIDGSATLDKIGHWIFDIVGIPLTSSA